MKLSLVIITFLLSFNAYAVLKINQSAPDFSLAGHDGKTYKLSDFKGKFVVLEWFNNDCPYVDKHYHEDARNMQKLQKNWIDKAKASGKELIWFSVVSSAPGKQGHVSAKEAAEIKTKTRAANMTAILLDPKGTVGREYSAKTTPHMFVIDPKGMLRYNGAIDNKPSARLSSLKGAQNYISAALKSLFSGAKVAKASTKPYGCSVKY